MAVMLFLLGAIWAMASPVQMCDSNTIKDTVQQLESDGHNIANTFGTIGYVYVQETIQEYSDGYDVCNDALDTSNGKYDYARLAVFETPTIYQQMMDLINANGVTNQVAIGAHNDFMDGSNLGQWYWTFSPDGRMCYIFDTLDGQHMPAASQVPATYTVGPIVGGSTQPFIWSAVPSNPNHVIPMANAAINLPVICEFGCGTGNYSMTTAWSGIVPTSSSTTSTSEASTPASDPAPASCAAGGPAYFCAKLQAKSIQTVFLGNKCYITSSIPTDNPGFNEVQQVVCPRVIANMSATSYIDYGHMAVFETPTIYQQVMAAWRGITGISKLMIGAYGNGNLDQYCWTVKGAGSRMCQIFSRDGVESGYGPAPTSYSLIVGSGSGQYVLAVDPERPNEFIEVPNDHLPTDGSVLALFEYGCGTGEYAKTPAWLNDTSLSTSTTVEITTLSTMESTSTKVTSDSTSSSGSTTSESSAASSSSCALSNCNAYSNSTIINGICYAFMGTSARTKSYPDAYGKCEAAKSNLVEPFEYGRVAMFQAPSVYKQFMDMLKGNGITEHVVIGAMNDGRKGSLIHEFMWALDGSSSMCYIFNDDGNTKPASATVKKQYDADGDPKTPPPGFLPKDYYVLCGDPNFPFDFWGAGNGDFDLPYACEFGCGPAPNYISTPAWHNIDEDLASLTSTSTATSTTTHSTTSSSTSSSSSETTSATTSSPSCTPATIASFCDTLKSQCYPTLLVGDICYAIGTVNSVSTATNFNPVVDDCKNLITTNKATASVGYGRFAVFETPQAYLEIMKAVENTAYITSPVVIGASTTSSATGDSLKEYFWTPDYEGVKMCLIFSADGTTQGTAPSQFKIKQCDGDSPCVLTADASSPYQFIARSTKKVTGPALFEYGCGNGNYTSTPPWLVNPTPVSSSSVFDRSCATTTKALSSTSSSSSSSRSTSTSKATAPPASASCDITELPGLLKSLLDALGAVLKSVAVLLGLSPPPPPAPFVKGITVTETSGEQYFYGYVDIGDDKAPQASLSSMDSACLSKCQEVNKKTDLYGRTAILRSRKSYGVAYNLIQGYDSTKKVIVGASTTIGTQTTLDKFSWTTINTNDPSPSSPIMTQSTIVVNPGSPVGSINALAIDPASSDMYQGFIFYNATKLSTYNYLCECGCAPYQTVSSTAPGWDIPTTTASTTTTTTTSSATTTMSTTAATAPPTAPTTDSTSAHTTLSTTMTLTPATTSSSSTSTAISQKPTTSTISSSSSSSEASTMSSSSESTATGGSTTTDGTSSTAAGVTTPTSNPTTATSASTGPISTSSVSSSSTHTSRYSSTSESSPTSSQSSSASSSDALTVSTSTASSRRSTISASESETSTGSASSTSSGVISSSTSGSDTSSSTSIGLPSTSTTQLVSDTSSSTVATASGSSSSPTSSTETSTSISSSASVPESTTSSILSSTSTAASTSSASSAFSSSKATESASTSSSTSSSSGYTSMSSSSQSSSSDTETSSSSSSSTSASEGPTSSSATSTTASSSGTSTSGAATPTETSSSNSASTESTSISTSAPTSTSAGASSTEASSSSNSDMTSSASAAETSTSDRSTQSISSSGASTSSAPSSPTTSFVPSESTSSNIAPTSMDSAIPEGSTTSAESSITTSNMEVQSSSTLTQTPTSDSTSVPSSSSGAATTTAQSTDASSTSESSTPSIATVQTSSESTVPTSAIISSTAPASSSLTFTSSIAVSSSTELQSTSTDFEDASDSQSSFLSTSLSEQSTDSSTERLSTDSSSTSDFTSAPISSSTALENESTASAAPTITSSTSATTEEDVVDFSSTTDRSTSSHPSSADPFEITTRIITETVPVITTMHLLSSAGVTTELTVSPTAPPTDQSTSQTELSTADYDKSTVDVPATSDWTSYLWTSSPQKPTVHLHTFPTESTSSIVEETTTVGTASSFEATTTLTPMDTTEFKDQSTSTDGNESDSTKFSSSTPIVTNPPSSSSSSAVPTSGRRAGSSHRGMARTEGTIAPVEQLVMETNSASTSSASSTLNGVVETPSKAAPSTRSSLNEVTSDGGTSDGSMTTTQKDQVDQEGPIDLAIDPIDQMSTAMDHVASLTQTRVTTADSTTEDSSTTSSSRQEVRDTTMYTIQRRSLPTSSPMSQSSSVSTRQGSSIRTGDPTGQSSSTTGAPVTRAITIADQQTPTTSMINDQKSSTRALSTSAIDYSSMISVGQSPRTASSSTTPQPTHPIDSLPINPEHPQSPSASSSQSQSTTSESITPSAETSESSLLIQTASSSSLSHSTPSLVDLLISSPFRFPPNANIDNFITLRPRFKQTTTTSVDTTVIVGSPSPNPQVPLDSFTANHLDSQSSEDRTTGSTTTPIFGNAGNSNQSTSRATFWPPPFDQMPTLQVSPTGLNSDQDSSDFGFFSTTGVSSQSFPSIGTSNIDVSRLSNLVTLSTAGLNGAADGDGANSDNGKGRSKIPSSSTSEPTSPLSGSTAIDGEPNVQESDSGSSDGGHSNPTTRLNNSSTNELSSAKSTTEASGPGSTPNQPVLIKRGKTTPNAESQANQNDSTGSRADTQSTASIDRADSKKSEPASSGSPTEVQQLPNDANTNSGEVHQQPTTASPSSDPNALEVKPSTVPAAAVGKGGPSSKLQESSTAPPEPPNPPNPDSASSKSQQTDLSPSPLDPTGLLLVDKAGSTGPATSQDHNESSAPVDSRTDTTRPNAFSGSTITATPAGPVAHPSNQASSPTSSTNSSNPTSDHSTIPASSNPTRSPYLVGPTTKSSTPSTDSSSSFSNANPATGASSPSNSAIPPGFVSSSGRPTNDTWDSDDLGSDNMDNADPDAGDMDKDDVKGPRPVDPMTKPERLAADIMHSLGCIWLVACSGACFVLGMITNHRSPDRQLSYSQELSLMLQHLLILLCHDATAQSTLCTAVSIAIQYFTLVYFTSMLLDSTRNLCVIVAFLDRANQIPSMAMQAAAWGAPALITSASAIMYYKHYDSEFSCWINAAHPVSLFTIAPVGIMSALGIIINEASGTLMPCQWVPNGMKDSFHTSFISRHGFFFLLPLSLSSWAIGFSAVFYQKLSVYVTVSGINIGLGVALFFFHALQNDQIRALLIRMWTRIKAVF